MSIMTPILEELAMEFLGKVKFYKLNVEQFPEIAKRFDVQIIPTLLIFKKDRVSDRLSGMISKSEFN